MLSLKSRVPEDAGEVELEQHAMFAKTNVVMRDTGKEFEGKDTEGIMGIELLGLVDDRCYSRVFGDNDVAN